MSTAVMSFGRFNPPHTGHKLVADTVKTVAKKEKGTPLVYLSHTQNQKKDPLTYEQKVKFAKAFFGNVVQKSKAKTVIQIAQELDNKYDNLVMVVGADRLSEFKRLLNNYNGKEYSFDSIKIVSAGDRDPDADDVTGMSASKMRKLAAEGDFGEFKKGVPKATMARALYDATRQGLSVNERFEQDEIFSLIEQCERMKDWDDLTEDIENNRRFNSLLRFGLVDDRDIPIARRAFSNMSRAKVDYTLRDIVFEVTDRLFEYMLEDDLLYNRLLMLVQRDKFFNRDD